MSPTAFRCVVVASILLPFAATGVDLLFPALIPAGLAKAAEAEPLSPLFDQWWFGALTIAFGLTALAGIAGLLLFRRWGRTLSLWSSVAALAYYPMLGAGVGFRAVCHALGSRGNAVGRCAGGRLFQSTA